jgi:hypothetical protein
MSYFKGILSALAAIIIADVVPGLWSLFRGINGSKATGLAVITGSLAESLFSPLFWILVILIFAMFFATSRLGNKALRVIFFWIPTLTVTGIVLAIAALISYIALHFRNS